MELLLATGDEIITCPATSEVIVSFSATVIQIIPHPATSPTSKQSTNHLLSSQMWRGHVPSSHQSRGQYLDITYIIYLTILALQFKLLLSERQIFVMHNL